MRLLNLGCGSHFHKDWINIDFSPKNAQIIEYNLLNGIPFNDNEFNVVYHSHLLEHLSKKDGILLVKECHRVLKPGGIIRVVVPDLEIISIEYLRNLRRVLKNEPNSAPDYNWILLEMFDQFTRDESGGEMARYLCRKEIPNIEYIYSRIGDEASKIHSDYLRSNNESNRSTISSDSLLKINSTNFFKRTKNKLFRVLFKEELEKLENNKNALRLGQFRPKLSD